MVDDENGYTQIRVSWKLANALKDIGKKGETYEDVIWRLVNVGEQKADEPELGGWTGLADKLADKEVE